MVRCQLTSRRRDPGRAPRRHRRSVAHGATKAGAESRKEGEGMARSSLGRKALSTLVAATLVVSLNAPISAWAGDDAAGTSGGGYTSQEVSLTANEASSNGDTTIKVSVGGTDVESLKAAISLASEENTVKLLKDVTEDVDIPAGKTVNLDLNGHKLTNVSGHTITNNGTLTITDSSTDKTGTIDNLTHGKAALVNKGTATLNGGTFERSQEKGVYEPYGNGGNSYYTIMNDGSSAEMTVNDGAKIVNKGGYSSNVINNHGAVLTVNGGIFEGGINAFKNDNDAENDKKPTLYIKGGEFKNTVQYAVQNWSIATISGGTFSVGEKAKAVLFNSSYSGVENKLDVTGGTFGSAGGSLPVLVNKYDDSNTGTASISGGTFSGDPTEWLATGFTTAINADGNYIVGKDVAKAMVGGKAYTTLQLAINAAADGDTVTMISDESLASTVTVAEKQKITLDLNGKTIFKDSGNAVEVSGDLVVKDSTAKQPTAEGAEVSKYEGGVITAKNAALCAVDGGSITLESGKVQSTGNCAVVSEGNTAYANSEPVASTVIINGGYVLAQEFAVLVKGNGAVANVAGGVLEAKDNAVVGGNGTVSQEEGQDLGGTEINISGGQLVGHITSSGYIACGVYHPQAGTLNITGGSIYAENGVGVLMRGGVANITGGTIQTTGNVSGKVGDSGLLISCSGVFVDGEAAYLGATDGLSASISGSAKIFTSTGDSSILKLTKKDGSAIEGSIAVTGGTFSSEPGYVADGYTAVKGSDGNYVVAAKPAETDQATADDGKASGSTTAYGVAVDNSSDMAEKAAETAAALKDVKVDSSSGSVTINGTKVSFDSDQAKDLAAVAEAANAEGAKVDVNLVVKADTAVDSDVEIAAQAPDAATIIPFDLSVDMVAKVTSSKGEVTDACVPVAETASPITVTIKVDPKDIKDKCVSVARNHDGVVAVFAADNVDYKTGEVTFKTDKFSKYALFAASNDEAAKFIKFRGGSLRMDVGNPATETYLRFGYNFELPEGATYVSNGWTYYVDANDQHTLEASNNLLYEDGTFMSNLVITNVPLANYDTSIYVKAYLIYKDSNNKEVKVEESGFNKRSVKEVANSILKNSSASTSDRTYAQGVVGALSKKES